MADPTLLATPPAPAPATTEPVKAAPAAEQKPAAEPAKTLIGEPPKPEQPKAMDVAEKLYGKLVEKVVTDGDKKESAKEPAKAEEKKPEPAKTEPVKADDKSAEIKYELKAPDGSPLAPADVEKVASLAKEAKLAPEVAQKVLEAQSRMVTEYRDRLVTEFQKTSQQWVSDLKADKEFGGEKFNETVESAKRAFHAYAGPELVKLMNDTGYGNHPEVLKMFARIGAGLKEGRFVSGGQPVVAQKGPANKLYPNMPGDKK